MKRTIPLCLQLLWILLLFQPLAAGQVGYRTPTESARERVLDLLFSRNVITKDYYVRLVLRFSNPDSQLVLMLYPGGSSDVVRYTLSGNAGENVSQVASAMLQRDPRVDDKKIAERFRVTEEKLQIDQVKVQRALGALKKINISPFFDTASAVDERQLYDFWFDSGGESVHYSFFGPYKGKSKDELVQWMIEFRDALK